MKKTEISERGTGAREKLQRHAKPKRHATSERVRNRMHVGSAHASPSAILKRVRIRKAQAHDGRRASQWIYRLLAAQAQRLRAREFGYGHAALCGRTAARGRQKRLRGDIRRVRRRRAGGVSICARPCAFGHGEHAVRPREVAHDTRDRSTLVMDRDRPECGAAQRTGCQAARRRRCAPHGRRQSRRLWAWRRALRQDGSQLGCGLPGRCYCRRGCRAARGFGERARPRLVGATRLVHPAAFGVQGDAERLHARVRHPLRRDGRCLRDARAVSPGLEYGHEPHRRASR